MDDSYKPDKRDFKIIEAIADNARFPYSRIGKMTRISKDRVRERLINLNKEKFILSYFPLIDYTKLGYRLFHVFILFRNIYLDNYFYSKILRCQSLVAFTRLAGKYDYELQILAQSKDELKKILKNLEINKKNFQYVLVLSSSVRYHYTMQVYSEKKHLTDYAIQIKNSPLKDKTTFLDKRILRSLCFDARRSTVSIAAEIGSSEDIVRYRIKALIKKGIIQRFYTRTNKHRFGLSSYILLIKLDESNKIKCKELIKQSNIYYIEGCTGRKDLIINFYAKDNRHLIKTLDIIRKTFKEKLKQSELHILLDRYIFNPFPKVLS